MKFVSYNIQYSLGRDGRFELERIAEAVAQADVIALQEVVRNMPDPPDADQPARLAELLPEHYWVYGATADIDASERGADGRVINKRMQFGNMLLSRYPILSSRLLLLPRMRSYDKHNLQQGALEGILDLPSGPLRVYAVHLNHLNGAERILQLDYLMPKLLAVPQEGAAWTGPDWRGLGQVPLSEEFVVLGDCNLTPDSPEYIRVVGEPDYYYGARIVRQHWVDSWTQAGHGRDEGETWHDETRNWELGLRLDYGFVSAGLAAKVKSAHIDSDAPGSDHLPYWFELEI